MGIDWRQGSDHVWCCCPAEKFRKSPTCVCADAESPFLTFLATVLGLDWAVRERSGLEGAFLSPPPPIPAFQAGRSPPSTFVLRLDEIQIQEHSGWGTQVVLLPGLRIILVEALIHWNHWLDSSLCLCPSHILSVSSPSSSLSDSVSLSCTERIAREGA